nr:MAG TPA: hypothetical protein [Caudoviricetes sp.]
MAEFSTLSDIFGCSAWPIIKEMSDVVVFNVDANDRSCSILLNDREYKIKRAHHRRWHAVTTGYWRTFGSQWELLAWIGDRL